ncbi:MAG: hypothetical protein COZ69_11020 [Deltaproteobacteria bacterium CG_4_8_14_3_um_filter_45_9]|nr:MAG: hypothetical protein COS40_14020 [Deltaproteobacteria bacterium CG03_land_8_20_14_0_80_45_14]PIX22470.1 MAG: hypothetical protein COZ69_11020 [Deltaproteobacteria bacterium CG_4_8_14_3_um_filter_45_9]
MKLQVGIGQRLLSPILAHPDDTVITYRKSHSEMKKRGVPYGIPLFFNEISKCPFFFTISDQNKKEAMMEKAISRLKLFRLKRGLTQKQLAEKAGLPVWKISQWESGKRIPTLMEMLRVQIVLKGNLFVFNPLELKEVRER